jgi:hypothetical protein
MVNASGNTHIAGNDDDRNGGGDGGDEEKVYAKLIQSSQTDCDTQTNDIFVLDFNSCYIS